MDGLVSLPSPLVYFEADTPHVEQGLVLSNPAQFQIERREGKFWLYLPPSGQYYGEDEWVFACAKRDWVQKPGIVLEIEYWDEGFGVIEVKRTVGNMPRKKSCTPNRRVSYTRLNSKRIRKAAFAFAQGWEDSQIGECAYVVITGVQHLHAVRIYDALPETYWCTLAQEIPHGGEPEFSLKSPMEIVCSAPGASVGTAEEDPEEARSLLREFLPLAKALGFTAIESYVRWNYVEPRMGEFDWSRYDLVVEELQRVGLKWFPLLIVGSAYTLPDWFADSSEKIGFCCLEHGLTNPIQSIWSPFHKKHVTRFLKAFGAHYEPMNCLEGVRLGPSGNYGESQYPAGGNWGYRGKQMHIHIGMWCGDPYAQDDFRRFLRDRYGDIDRLNAAWDSSFRSFEEIFPKLPDACLSKRERVDLYTWYTDSMSQWCEWWATEARQAMPQTRIYQSAGGWGAAEIGTDYSAQTKSMLKVDGGIRLTNELDSFHQCFYATRLAATAARLYGVPLGFEPAMGHTARGVTGRLFNCVTNNGQHFFTYHANVFHQQTAIQRWQSHYCLLDDRSDPFVEVALYYPQTNNFLSHDTFRFLNAWGFNPYAREIRNRVEVDYLDDRLIQEGFLSRYKVLVFVWGDFIERVTLEAIDRWLRRGGVIIFPYFLNMRLATVEDDTRVFDRWMNGDIDDGKFFRYVGDDEPPSSYAEYVRKTLESLSVISDTTRIALQVQKPDRIFVSARHDNTLWVLNFSDELETLQHPRIGVFRLEPYTFRRVSIR